MNTVRKELKINKLFDEKINFGMWLTGLDRESVIKLYDEYLNRPSIFHDYLNDDKTIK